MNYVRRFVFVQYADLLHIRFRKLEKVTDKLFVFTPEAVAQVPMWLVRQMQRMGTDLEWVDLGEAGEAAAAAILAFHVGQMHEKVDLGVEFALLSDDDGLDAFVEHIRATGRSCVRVRQRLGDAGEDASGPDSRVAAAAEAQREDVEDLDLDLGPVDRLAEGLEHYAEAGLTAAAKTEASPAAVTQPPSESKRPPLRGLGNRRSGTPAQATADATPDPERVQDLADELVRRLIRSGNRPSDVSMLRSYILLHLEESDAVRYVDAIIAHLTERREILVDEGAVAYGF